MRSATGSSIWRRLVQSGVAAFIATTTTYAQTMMTDGLTVSRGKDLPVCQAYLQRLKRSHFETSPFCGRPEQDSVAGFVALERRPLSELEALPLVNRVLKFINVGDQNQAQRTYYANPEHPNLSHWSDDLELPEAIADFGTRTIVWTYSAPLDIENNGSPQRLLLWQGYPAVTRSSAEGPEGLKASNFPCTQTRAFVLSADGTSLDEAKTRALFTTAAYVSTLESPSSKAATLRRVIPLGDSLGILLYQGRYYIDSVDRPESKNASLTYSVFLHQDGQTRKVCSLH